MDFIEIAKYCHDRVAEECRNASVKKHYRRTLYAAIGSKDEITVSETPHVLSNAVRCILIHEWSQKAVTQWYDTYRVEYISADGSVNNGCIDEHYKIGITPASFNTPAKMYLERNDEVVFLTSNDTSGRSYYNVGWVPILKDVWQLYLKCKKECHSDKEIRFLCEVQKHQIEMQQLRNRIEKEQYYQLLVQIERDAYIQVLNEIKEIINRK